MKLTKNSNSLFVGLALILSLVSFSGVTSYTPADNVKTTLVVDNKTPDLRRSIVFKNACKTPLVSTITFLVHHFKTFQYTEVSNECIAFKTYLTKTIGLKAYQLHTNIYPTTALKQLYQLS